jgi:hypothetical protein
VAIGQSNFTFNAGGSAQSNFFSTVPYQNINEKIIVSVKIKGKAYKFILDTGAPTTISKKIFDELSPDPITKIPITDINQITDSLLVVQLKDIAIGDVAFTNIPALVANDNPFFQCFEADGFIGSNLLRELIIQFNNNELHFIITDNENKLSLNPKRSSALFLDKQSSPVITVSLKNKKRASEQLLLDLGASGFYNVSLNHFRIFDKYKIFKVTGKARGNNTIGVFELAQDTTQYRLLLPEMRINGTKILNVSTETTVSDNSRIGSQILEYGTVTIDYKNKRFYFEPFSDADIYATKRSFPVDLMIRNNQLTVGFIWDEELYTHISVGDQITAIDGLSYEDAHICQLIINNSFALKDKVTLTTINSKGEKVETLIERK